MSFFYSIVISVIIASITFSVTVCIFLPRIWYNWTIILNRHDLSLRFSASSQNLQQSRRVRCNLSLHQDIHQDQYPCRTQSHSQPSQLYTILNNFLSELFPNTFLICYFTNITRYTKPFNTVGINIAHFTIRTNSFIDAVATNGLISDITRITITTIKWTLSDKGDNLKYDELPKLIHWLTLVLRHWEFGTHPPLRPSSHSLMSWQILVKVITCRTELHN